MLRGKKYKIIKFVNSFLTILILIIMIGTDVYSRENKKNKVCKLLGSALDIGHNFIKIHYKLCPMSRADPKFTISGYFNLIISIEYILSRIV